MRNWLSGLAYLLLVTATILAVWFLLFGGYLNGDISKPDANKARDIQPFITGLVVPLLTLGSTLLVIATLQSNTLQNFSNNFFKLIDQYHKLVDNFETQVEGFEHVSRGKEFFDDLATRIYNDYETLSSGGSIRYYPVPLTPNFFIVKYHPVDDYDIDETLRYHAQGKVGKELLLVIYDHFYYLYLSDLGHYFRNLYHIVRFAEKSELSKIKTQKFVKILRAQLSNYEILMLAYNGVHEKGKKFYRLLEEYELLKNLDHEDSVPITYIKRVDKMALMQWYPHLNRAWNPETKVSGKSFFARFKPAYWG
jgi:hypothetical protein